MIKMIVTIDTLGGIVLTPNTKIKDYQEKKMKSGTKIYVPESCLEDFLDTLDLVVGTSHILESKGSKWITGCAGVFEAMIEYADELHITQINGVTDTHGQFPRFGNDFIEVSRGKIKHSDGVVYQHQVWQSKRLAGLHQFTDTEAR